MWIIRGEPPACVDRPGRHNERALMSVLAFLTGTRRRKVALGSSAVLVSAGAWMALPSDAAATKNNLTVSPSGSLGAATGSSVSGGIIFGAAAPGCTSGDSAVVTMKGPGAAA